MPMSTAERAARVKEKRKAAGMKRLELWVTLEEKMLLKVYLEQIRYRSSSR